MTGAGWTGLVIAPQANGEVSGMVSTLLSPVEDNRTVDFL
jgi:hypothetical protein